MRFDVGAEAFLHRKPEAQELINEVGLADHVVHPTAAKASVHAAGRTHQLPAHTFMGVPASVETVRHMLSSEGALRVEMEPTLPPIELRGGDVAVGALMKDRFGPRSPTGWSVRCWAASTRAARTSWACAPRCRRSRRCWTRASAHCSRPPR